MWLINQAAKNILLYDCIFKMKVNLNFESTFFFQRVFALSGTLGLSTSEYYQFAMVTQVAKKVLIVFSMK